jgi:hypothetical protein
MGAYRATMMKTLLHARSRYIVFIVLGLLAASIGPWYLVPLLMFPLTLFSHSIILLPVGLYIDLLYGSPYVVFPYALSIAICFFVLDMIIRPKIATW